MHSAENRLCMKYKKFEIPNNDSITSVLIFDDKQVFNVIKILRKNSNAGNNCTHLSKDLMEYFKTNIVPKHPSSTVPSAHEDFNVLITTAWIKQENDTKYLGIIKSIVCRDSTTFSDIPCDKELKQTSDGIYDVEAEPIY